MSNIVLSAQSSSNEVKSYFNSVLTLTKSGEKFPVNLDDVWPLCYAKKQNATLLLTTSGQFYEGEDYVLSSSDLRKMEGKNLMENEGVFTFSGKNSENGRPTNKYMLSVPCMEYLIARKVRAVFEVYRRVFHEFFNMKRMSKAEMRLQVFMDMQSEISRQSNVIKKQGKRITSLLSRLESEKEAKRLRLTLASETKDEDVARWLSESGIKGVFSLSSLFVNYSAFCENHGISYDNKKKLSSALRNLGFTDIRRAQGICFII